MEALRCHAGHGLTQMLINNNLLMAHSVAYIICSKGQEFKPILDLTEFLRNSPNYIYTNFDIVTIRQDYYRNNLK
jgi:hypothetical protein